MKKIIFPIMIILFISFALAAISPSDKDQINDKIELFQSAVNNDDSSSVNTLYMENYGPKESSVNSLSILDYKIINYTEQGNSVIVYMRADIKTENTIHEDSKIKIVFRKTNEDWKITSTTTFNILEVEKVIKGIGTVFSFGMIFFGIIYMGMFCIGMILFVIWIVMLIDLVKRDFEDSNQKMLWVIILLFGGGIGAIIYYFMVKKKSKKE